MSGHSSEISPIDTSQLYRNIKLNSTNDPRKDPNYFGFGYRQNLNPFYRTMNAEYGLYAPNSLTMAEYFFPRPQKFSSELSKFGMYRNYSLNTGVDKTYF